MSNSFTPPKFKEMENFLSANVNNLKNFEDASFTRFAQPAMVSGPFQVAKFPQTTVFKSQRNATDRKSDVSVL